MISSIGSVPEILPGVAMKGEYYSFTGDDLPRYTGCDRSLFGVRERSDRTGQCSSLADAPANG